MRRRTWLFGLVVLVSLVWEAAVPAVAADEEGPKYTWPEIKFGAGPGFTPEASRPWRFDVGGSQERWDAVRSDHEEKMRTGRTYTDYDEILKKEVQRDSIRDVEYYVLIEIVKFPDAAKAGERHRWRLKAETTRGAAPEGVPDLGRGTVAKDLPTNMRADFRILTHHPKRTHWAQVILPSERGDPIKQFKRMGGSVHYKSFAVFIDVDFMDFVEYKPDVLKAQLMDLERIATAACDWWDEQGQPQDRVALEHEPPTFDANVKDGGGRIIATVRDARGKPVPNREVFVYVDRGETLHRVLRLGQRTKIEIQSGAGRYQVLKDLFPTISFDNFWFGKTDAGGKLHLDYLHGGLFFDALLNFSGENGLARTLLRTGPVRGTVRAALLNKSISETEGDPPEIVSSTSMPVEFSCIARLTHIGSTTGTEPKVRIMRVDLETGGLISDAKITRGARGVGKRNLPRELLPGDTILMDGDDVVHLEWIDGTRMVVMTKPGWLDDQSWRGWFKGTWLPDGEKHPPLAMLTICHRDLGWFRAVDKFIQDKVQAFFVGTVGCTVVGIKYSTPGAAASVATGSFVFGWGVGQDFQDPFLVQYRSTILVDTDVRTRQATLYTLEGTGEVANAGHPSPTAVTTGQKMTISGNGQLGTVGKFAHNDLHEGLRLLAKELERPGEQEPVVSVIPREPGQPEQPNAAALAAYQRGVEFQRQEKTDEAIAAFGEAIRLDPEFAEAYNERGAVYANHKREYDKALADVDRACQLDPQYAKAFSNRGILYLRQEEYDRAIADLARATELDPQMALAFNSRGICYAHTGRIDRAIDDYTRAIKLDPDEARYYYNRGHRLEEKGETERALDDFNTSIRCDSDYAKPYYARGEIYKDRREYERAIADFTETVRCDPEHEKAYYYRGYCRKKLGQLPDAIADYSRAIEVDAEYAKAYCARANTYDDLNEDAKAIDDYTRAIELNPRYTEAYNNRGYAHKKMGRLDEALADYSRAIEIDPDYAYAYNNRGNVYRQRGQYEKALSDYSEAIRSNPKYARAYRNRGKTYRLMGEESKAKADLAKAEQLEPN